jgi:hypothetical protein
VKRSVLQGIVGVLIGLAFLFVAVRQVEGQHLREAVRAVTPGWIAAAVLLYAVDIALRVARWRLLLEPVARLSYPRVATALVVGYAVNNLLPARLGEIFRADFLKRHSGVPRAGALGAIVVERLLDASVVVAALNVGLLLVPSSGGALGSIAVISSVGLVVAGGLFVALALSQRRGSFRRWPSIDRRVGQLVRPLEVIRRPELAPAAALTAVLWTFEALALHAVLRASGIHIGAAGLLLVVGAASLSTLVPSAPGYVGTYQLAYVLAIAPFGYGAASAIVAGSIVQIFLLGTVTIVGTSLLVVTSIRRATSSDCPDPTPERC